MKYIIIKILNANAVYGFSVNWIQIKKYILIIYNKKYDIV